VPSERATPPPVADFGGPSTAPLRGFARGDNAFASPPTAAPIVNTRCDHAPRIASLARPAYDARALRAGENGTTVVRVALDASGSVTGTSVYRTSGFADLDAAVKTAAGRTRYAAGMTNCRAVASTFLYVGDAELQARSAPHRVARSVHARVAPKINAPPAD
jgi:TonB family protein